MTKLTVSFVIILLEMLLVRQSSSIAPNELIPFGRDNGDVLVPQGDDSANSGKVDIATPFHFFGQYFTSLYVNINGVITFKKPFSKYVPKPFPLSDDTVMIAPFWADVDTRERGAIWYRQTTSRYLLKNASMDVRKAFPEFPQFSAKRMFVATWEKVTFVGTKNVENITNTFQSVLLTDGRYSFVRFNYHNITWTSATTTGGSASTGLGGTEAMCGFNAGFGNYSYVVTTNNYRNISVLDLPYKTNVNKPGVWMFRTDNIAIQEGKVTPAIPSLPNALDRFIPFGEGTSDTLIVGSKTRFTGINISTPFPFLGKSFTSLAVVQDIGALVFFHNMYRTGYIVAPFFIKQSRIVSKRGRVWYRQITSKNALEVASTDVRTSFSEFPHFLANWMLVVTLEKVPFLSKNITNTFQVVLLTDGRYSFVRFNYDNIIWTSLKTFEDRKDFLSSIQLEGMAGFFEERKNKPGLRTHFAIAASGLSLLREFYFDALSIPYTLWDLPFLTNVGKPGVWMFRTDGITIQEGKVTPAIPSLPNALDRFIPFGEGTSDTLIVGNKTLRRIMINMSTPFPFVGKTFKSLLFLNNTGTVRFNDTRKYAIAPFYASYDLSKGGRIWYRQITLKHELEVASTAVRTTFPHFLANWMLVITWEKVPFHYSKEFQNITNTFQIVLLTDGRYSFVRFNYGNITGTSLKTTKDKADFLSSSIRRGVSGFFAAPIHSFVLALYFRNQSFIRNITLLDLSTKTNVGKPGVWIFRTDEPIIRGLGLTYIEQFGELSSFVNESTKTKYPTNPCGLLILILIIEFIIS